MEEDPEIEERELEPRDLQLYNKMAKFIRAGEADKILKRKEKIITDRLKVPFALQHICILTVGGTPHSVYSL